MAPRVAVLIVNYHVYDDIDRLLRSLEPRLAQGDEVVVLDQESQEAERQTLERAHPKVLFLPVEGNEGFAAGVNRAARASSAPYLLWLNPDTDLDPRVVDTLADWLDAHPDAGIIGPRVVNADGSVQASARRFPGLSTLFGGRTTWLSRAFPGNPLTSRNLVGREAEGPLEVDWVAGACVLTRRSLFDQLHGLDEGFFMYWEDADYARRARTQGQTCVYLPTVTVRHWGGRSSARNPAPSIRAFHASAYRLYWKHSGAAGRLAAPLVKLGLWLRGEWKARLSEPPRHSRSG